MTEKHPPREIVRPPAYPEITRAQWAVLSAWTDQRCENMMESADFVADLSPAAKKFLKEADEKKIEQLNSNMEFFATSKAVWKFLWIGGATLFGLVVGISQLWEHISKYFKITLKP
jgi:hypothetical protein